MEIVKPRVRSLLILLTTIIIYLWLSNHPYYRKYLESKMEKYQKELLINSNKIIPFFVVMCKETPSKKNNYTSTSTRQLSQAGMLLKSAAALTKVTLKFTIFADSESLFQDVVSPLKHWPQEYQRRLQIEFQPVRYPPGSDELRNEFKSCSTYPLLLPDIMQHVDAAVYLDTDTIFLRPPEDLWKEFNKFNNEEAAGLALDTFYILHAFRHPFPGVSGFNTGVVLMNLTRLRSAPGGGYSEVMMNLHRQYKEVLTLGDQGLINIYFEKYPKLLRELSCHWNYAFVFCKNGRNSCLEALKQGASIVHGSDGSFIKQDRFMGLFEAWKDYQLGTPIQKLMMKIQLKLANYNSQSESKNCTNANVASILTKKLALYTH